MMINLPVPQQPMPVFYPEVKLDARYVVVRGDGKVKIFEALNSGPGYDSWQTLYNKTLPSNVVLIPLDLLTAHRLGLVHFEEMMLPEAARAFLHLIQPHP